MHTQLVAGQSGSANAAARNSSSKPATQSASVNAAAARSLASKPAGVASSQKVGGGEEVNESGADNESTEGANSLNQIGPVVDQVSISDIGKSGKFGTDQSKGAKVDNAYLAEQTQAADSTVAFKKIDGNQIVMQVLDKNTGEILKQYPPEEMQKVSQALNMFVDSQKPQNAKDFFSVA